ncbi:hypothetical protein A0H81_10723 [Grifola frondosa]|uniref:Uncharacterized protein n=1 Tax=Grifola frondosa TaxID=5627 RepID=A0A1C7LWP8_GRIFR|nr:hypothetical protein A0H81_10723 [Grifola frondosa]
MWAPFLSQPPQAPYLLSIPVPRCLSNHLKLRIFPPHPASAASSLASISSAEEDAVWDLTTDPHVTRGASNRISRSHSYTHFADDESSDASTSAGFADGCGIQGTFPSTERLRIRWATPLKAGQVPETVDGRRRVGIDEVKGDMTCFVLGKDRGRGSQGLMMRVQYEAICRGLWFPGVATLLALDVGLDAEDYDVSWVPGMESRWLISGGPGFTGFDVGGPPQAISRQSSEDMPPINVLPSSPETGGNVSSLPPARYDSPSPLASLLHAPLPAQNIADYSFEASPVSTPVSSTTSLPPPRTPEPGPRSGVSSVNGQYLDTDTDLENDGLARPPKVPVTVHLNLNDLLPPAKEEFKFNVSGTILLTPRQSTLNLRLRDSSPSQEYATSDSDSDSEPVVVPRFRVLYTGKESTSYTIVSEADRTAVDVYNSVGDIHNTQTRRTVLQKGGQIKCGMDGARIALHRLSSLQSTSVRGRRDRSMDSVRSARGRSRPLAPSGVTLRESSPSMLRQSVLLSNTRSILRRDGPLMIPFVTATITPLLNGSQSVPDAYAVQICLPAPSDADTEWLEFGLALPSADSLPSGSNLGDRSRGDSANSPPRVEVASASVEGVPVRFETSAAMKQDTSVTGLRLPFDETSAKEWMTWVRVHIGDLGGGKVEIVYLVKGKREGKGDENGRDKGKQRAKDQVQLNVLLPSFSLPVGRLEVNIQVQAGFELASLRTNLTHQQSSPQGLRCSDFAENNNREQGAYIDHIRDHRTRNMY